MVQTSSDFLLYKGRVNAVVGHSGSGKSMVAQVAASQVAASGHNVIWIDYEDTPQGLATRMVSGGLSKEKLFEHVRFVGPEMPFNDIARAKWLEEHNNPDLVVIDSVGESLAHSGSKGLDEEVANWFRTVPRWWARKTGAAVLVIDHVPKDTEADVRFAIGSQRKRAAIDGAMYRLDVVTAFAIGQSGHGKLIVAKDRYGHRREGSVAALLVVDPDPGRGEMGYRARLVQAGEASQQPQGRPKNRVGLRDAAPRQEPTEPGKPELLMERLSYALESSAGKSRRASELLDLVNGRRATKVQALEELVKAGWVIRIEEGRTVRYTLVAPYRKGSQEMNHQAELIEDDGSAETHFRKETALAGTIQRGFRADWNDQ